MLEGNGCLRCRCDPSWTTVPQRRTVCQGGISRCLRAGCFPCVLGGSFGRGRASLVCPGRRPRRPVPRRSGRDPSPPSPDGEGRGDGAKPPLSRAMRRGRAVATAWRSHTRRVGKRPSRLDFAVCAPRASARMGRTPRNRLQVEHCRARMRSNVRPVMRSWARQVWRHGCAAVRRRRKPPACGGRADRPGGIQISAGKQPPPTPATRAARPPSPAHWRS